jgi:type IV pilus assembly protein PilW
MTARQQRGFSLIELMVGMAIGLLCTLVIAAVLSVTEGQRRGTTQGSDSQVNGSLALYGLQREVAVAGYGFATEENALGCPLVARFNSQPVTVLPPQLAPVFITEGGVGVSDTLRVVYSSKFIGGDPAAAEQIGYTVPARVISPLYTPADLTGLLPKDRYNVKSSLGVRAGDLMVAVIAADVPCGLFEVTSVPDRGNVRRADDPTRWNQANHPAQAALAANADALPKFAGSALVNLGRLIDLTFNIDANQRLVVSELNTAGLTRTQRELQSGIVLFKAMYGRDTDADGAVDTYDYATPNTNASWLKVLSVRLAVVARSAQFEKTEVTSSNPMWDVGKGSDVAGAVSCGVSQCVELKVDGLSDWKHYRYKVFDVIVPLRNQRWKASNF